MDQAPSGLVPTEFRPGPPRRMCTDCGVSRLADPSLCGQACQFIKPDYPGLEEAVHGRAHDPQIGDERFFGAYEHMLQVRLREPKAGAQWTGITSTLGQRLLERNQVDAVLTIAPSPEDRWKPMPVLITDPADMAQCRGMRMGYAPLLALLETAKARGIERLAVIGIPCQVYALRALQQKLGFKRLDVIGTPCSDNTTTENFHTFLALLDERPETISYLEFRADFRVEIRFDDGRQRLIPFLQLPISKLPGDFFPLTCRTCVDYTNRLADITVGYMAGRGEQWVLVRNQRGAEILALIEDELVATTPTSAGKRAGAVKGFLANTERAAGGLPLRSMPDWLRPLMGWLMPRVGPRGLEFARARVEMKAIETVLHMRHQAKGRMRNMIPPHIWRLVDGYGIRAKPGETKDDPPLPIAQN